MQSNTIDAKAVFNLARKIECEEDRDEYLQQVCGTDSVLMDRVKALLRGHAKKNGLLESPVIGLAATMEVSITSEQTGTSIGPYKLLEQIGEGGMGSVYMAEQKQPVRRTVALKVIKLGMDTRQVVARFEAERQALAMMNHPNIAKVLDAGTTDSGRPYFVMELVKGPTITEYCDRQKLDTRQRLSLFITVCQAIQHAHQKGIIHRDIKPSNVLVEVHDVRPVPKVIDFGVAKAIGQLLTDKTLQTGFHQMVGTPLYMSPEQAGQSSMDVDTRSDVYSLGVLLYEILTGQTPFESETLRQLSFAEMQRMICEVDPPRPSARVSTLVAEILSTVSECRQVDHEKLSQQLRGELDWIVMKSLEKDRSRRYESAIHFAADVQRYLDDQPVHAFPPNTSYKLKKLMRRNKGLIVATMLVFASMVFGIVGLGWGLVLADKGRRQAESREQESKAATIAEKKAKLDALESMQAAEASSRKAQFAEQSARESEEDTKAFSNFLVNDILSTARPEGERGGLGIDVTVRQAIEEAAKRIGDTFQGRPQAEAIARHDIGVTYRLIGELEKAESFLREALKLRKKILGDRHEDTLDSQNSLAVALSSNGNDREALSLYEELLRFRKAKPGWQDDSRTFRSMRNLGSSYFRNGRLELAISLAEEALENLKRLLPPGDRELLFSASQLGTAYISAGKFDEGLSLLEEACELQTSTFGRDNPETLSMLESLAAGYANADKFDLALPLLEETIDLQKIKLGSHHPDTLKSMFNLATTYQGSGQLKKALPLLEENYRLRKDKLGLEHPRTLETMGAMGVCLFQLNRFQEAEAIFAELVPLLKRVLGDDHVLTPTAIYNLAMQYKALGKYDLAIPWFEEALKLRTAAPVFNQDLVLMTRNQLAFTYVDAHKLAKAIPLLIEGALELESIPDKRSQFISQVASLFRFLRTEQRFEEAEFWVRKRLKAEEQQFGIDSIERWRTLRLLGTILVDQKKFEEAEPILRDGRRHGPNDYTQFRHPYGYALLGWARQLKLDNPDAALDKAKEAEVQLLENYEGLKGIESELPGQVRHRVLTEAINHLIELYEFVERPDEVAKYRLLLPEPTASEPIVP